MVKLEPRHAYYTVETSAAMFHEAGAVRYAGPSLIRAYSEAEDETPAYVWNGKQTDTWPEDVRESVREYDRREPNLAAEEAADEKERAARVESLTAKYPEPEQRYEETPGDFYANKDAARSYWHDHLQAAREANAPSDEIRFLTTRYESACYVGD